MEKQQALDLLTLTEKANNEEIQQAYERKLALIEQKSATAPSDALKQKFEQVKASLNEARQLLIDASVPKKAQLSQTKLADLPKMGPGSGEIASLTVGTILANRYEIKAFIAQGGMGAVYRAFDKNRSEDIAIKVMLPELMRHDTAIERFLDEARLSSQLSHPNIVNVFDVQQVDEQCFLTMELLEGQDLRELMKNRALAGQHFTLDEVLEVISPICDALEHAHEITVHRDIKPENIYLTQEGKYKLMDFGIARAMSTSQRTQTGVASGTAYYMAPEQLKGSNNIDARADQYALAVLAYELLSGEVPAGAIDPLHGQVKGINKKVSAGIQKALSPKPENRFEQLSDFITALQGGKVVSFDLPWKTIGIAAGVLMVVLAIGGLANSGNLSKVWDAIKPVDKELIAQRSADIAQLQGEIKAYRKQLDGAERELNKALEKAIRENSNREHALSHHKKLIDDYLLTIETMTGLEGNISKGEALKKAGSLEKSISTFTQVRAKYKALLQQFTAAENIFPLTQKVNNTTKNKHLRAKKGWSGSVDVLLAQEQESQAKGLMIAGNFTDSLKYWQEALQAWENVAATEKSVLDARKQSGRAQNKWAQRKTNYNLEDNEFAQKAGETMRNATSSFELGKLKEAKTFYGEHLKQINQAYNAANNKVSEIDQERADIEAEKKRQEEDRLAQEEIDRAIQLEKDRIQNEKKRKHDRATAYLDKISGKLRKDRRDVEGDDVEGWLWLRFYSKQGPLYFEYTVLDYDSSVSRDRVKIEQSYKGYIHLADIDYAEQHRGDVTLYSKNKSMFLDYRKVNVRGKDEKTMKSNSNISSMNFVAALSKSEAKRLVNAINDIADYYKE